MGLLDGLFGSKTTQNQNTSKNEKFSSTSGLSGPIAGEAFNAIDLLRKRAGQGNVLPNELVAGLDENTRAGLEASRSGARSIAPILAQQREGLSDTLGGKYTDPSSNPFFQSVSDLVRSQVTPAVDSRFGAAGAFGSPLHQIGLAQGITRELSPHLFNAYQQERGIQNNAINNASGIAGQNATTVGNILQGVGNTFQGQNQRELDADRYRAEFGDQRQREGLNDYASQLANIAQFFRTNKGSSSGTGTGQSKGTQTEGQGNNLLNFGGKLGGALFGAFG